MINFQPLTPTQQVRLELRSRPGRYLSAERLSELTGLPILQVRSAVYVLSKQGNILRLVPLHRGGRSAAQAYAWDYRTGVDSRAGREGDRLLVTRGGTPSAEGGA